MNTFGKLFRISIFGESHGKGLGVTIDGCPHGLPLKEENFDTDLLRRKPGKKGTTPRSEKDSPNIISGVFNDHTTGAPITILFENSDVRSSDYDSTLRIPRPGHADFVASKRFGGFNDYRGGGHFSGRLTLALVAAGVIAKKVISPIGVKAGVISAGGLTDIEEAVSQALEDGDSVGGIVECIASEIPIGLGEPFFDSVESVISHLVFAIPAVKGIEFGSGFKAASMKGSQHNDPLMDDTGKTLTNNAGGISGGLTNGNNLEFRIAVKPTSSISKKQRTLNLETHKQDEMQIKGRHDACIALRVPVVLEAVTAITLADFLLLSKSHHACEDNSIIG